MPASNIKTAIQTILTDNVPTLKAVDTQYRALTPNSDTPRAIVWDLNFREQRQAAGAPGPPQIGLKSKLWRIGTHVVAYYKDSITGGDDFDTLLEAIESLYRGKPFLDGLADVVTPYSKLLKFAENMTRDKPPPELRGSGQYSRFDAIIITECEEWLNS